MATLKILKYLVPTAQLLDSVSSCLFTPCQITKLVKRRPAAKQMVKSNEFRYTTRIPTKASD